MSVSHSAGEYINSRFRDATPEGATIQWRHYDLMCALRGEEAIAAAKATDFRLRAYHENRESALNDIANILRAALPDERVYSEPPTQTGETTHG